MHCIRMEYIKSLENFNNLNVFKKYYNKYILKNEDQDVTLESAIAGLLSSILQYNPGVKVSKGELGECWRQDCSKLSSKEDFYYCKKCNNFNTNDFMLNLCSDKIKNLFEHSFLNLSSIKKLKKALNKSATLSTSIPDSYSFNVTKF